MKNTINHIFKNGTILLSILFLLSNCQQEELISDNAVQPKSEFKTRVLDKSELQLNISLTNKLNIVQKGFSNKKNKSVYSELYDFTIETDYAELIENEDGTFQSYTFPISRTTSNDLIENFILTLQEDGSYDATYISYNLTEQEKDDINNNISVDLTNKTNIVEITDDFLIFEVVQNKVSGYQLVEITTWTYDGSCNQGVSPCNVDAHDVGWVASISYILVYVSGNSSTSGIPDNADGGGSNYGSGFGGSGGFNSYTVTRPRDPNISKFNSFKIKYGRTLDKFETNLLTENITVSTQVFDYLKPNFFDEDQDFALLALEGLTNGNIVDFYDEIIYDTSFTNSNTECIHNKMKINTNNIYSKMLHYFSSSTQNKLTFKINNNLGADFGITLGDSQNPNFYTLNINQTLIENNGSNLMKFVTLAHELMHAYMFSELETLGFITFDSLGNATLLSINNCPQGNVVLNNQTVSDRFTTLICAMNNAGTLSAEWTHDLFNSNVFNIQDYRQELETLIYNDYDWSSESSTFTNEAISIFGTNWKQNISEAISWIGLENTIEYTNYINSYTTQPASQFLYITNINNKISNTNSNCP